MPLATWVAQYKAGTVRTAKTAAAAKGAKMTARAEAEAVAASLPEDAPKRAKAKRGAKAALSTAEHCRHESDVAAAFARAAQPYASASLLRAASCRASSHAKKHSPHYCLLPGGSAASVSAEAAGRDSFLPRLDWRAEKRSAVLIADPAGLKGACPLDS